MLLDRWNRSAVPETCWCLLNSCFPRAAQHVLSPALQPHASSLPHHRCRLPVPPAGGRGRPGCLVGRAAGGGGGRGAGRGAAAQPAAHTGRRGRCGSLVLGDSARREGTGGRRLLRPAARRQRPLLQKLKQSAATLLPLPLCRRERLQDLRHPVCGGGRGVAQRGRPGRPRLCLVRRARLGAGLGRRRAGLAGPGGGPPNPGVWVPGRPPICQRCVQGLPRRRRHPPAALVAPRDAGSLFKSWCLPANLLANPPSLVQCHTAAVDVFAELEDRSSPLLGPRPASTASGGSSSPRGSSRRDRRRGGGGGGLSLKMLGMSSVGVLSMGAMAAAYGVMGVAGYLLFSQSGGEVDSNIMNGFSRDDVLMQVGEVGGVGRRRAPRALNLTC